MSAVSCRLAGSNSGASCLMISTLEIVDRSTADVVSVVVGNSVEDIVVRGLMDLGLGR